MAHFSRSEAEILDLAQRGFPLAERPFDAIGSTLGMSGADVLATVAGLKHRGVIRTIAGIFSGESLGYRLSLVALRVPATRVEAAAAVINSHPGVSHNYLREHAYNLWFTLAEEDEECLRESARVIARACAADDCLLLRNERLFKIGFMLPIGEPDGDAVSAAAQGSAQAGGLDTQERSAVVLLQTDLPLAERPFDALAAGQGLSGAELIEAGRRLLAAGCMRRYAAVLRHVEAGYTHNAMTAWKTGGDASLEERIAPFMQERAVTHLYLRTLYPGRWEYPLFAMVHARSAAELAGLLESLGRRSGLAERLVLRSLHEYKKEKVIYFSPAFRQWKRLNYD